MSILRNILFEYEACDSSSKILIQLWELNKIVFDMPCLYEDYNETMN